MRLLDPAAGPELDPGRLRRHPDGDRHHVRRGHPRLAEVLAERDEGFIQITQATDNIKARPRVRRAARRGLRPPDPLQRDHRPAAANPEIHRRSLRWLDRVREKGLPIFGQTATLGPASCSPSSTGTSTTPARRGGRSRPAPRTRRWPRWPIPRCARRCSTRPSEADRRCRPSRPASAGHRTS